MPTPTRTPEIEVDPLESKDILLLSTRFIELRAQLFRDLVETTVELGQVLREARPLLHGHWARWLQRMQLTPRTAVNYMRLAQLAEQSPRIVTEWKELGTSKLYRVAALPPPARKTLLKRSERDGLLQMNDREFAALTKPHMARRRKVTADMRVHGLRMKLAAWSKTLAAAKTRGIKSPELKRGLDEDLAALIRVARECRRQL